MAKINIGALIEGAQKVVEAVKTMSPVIEKLGGPGVASIATIAIAAIGVIENVLDRVNDANVAISTQDEAKLRAMLAELQGENDKLAALINAS